MYLITSRLEGLNNTSGAPKCPVGSSYHNIIEVQCQWITGHPFKLFVLPCRLSDSAFACRTTSPSIALFRLYWYCTNRHQFSSKGTVKAPLSLCKQRSPCPKSR